MVVEDISFFVTVRALAYFLIFALFIFLEYQRSFHHLNEKTLKRQRLFNWNLGIIVICTGRVAIFTLPLTAAYMTELYQIGIHYWFDIPNWLMYILWFIVLDQIVYWTHRLMHFSDTLWEFHKVHHSEKSPNVTTTLRVHPLDYLLVNNFKVLAAFLIGPTFLQMLICDLIITVLLTWEHTNIKIPKGVERWLNRIIVVPSYHIYHHTDDRNSYNFATGLVIWDKLTKRQILPTDSDSQIDHFNMGLPKNESFFSIREALFRPFLRVAQQSLHQKLLVLFWVFAIGVYYIALMYPQTTYGLLGPSPYLMIVYFLLCFHISMITISIYLHRSETHRAITYAPILRHFFRLWLWLVPGIDRKHWVAVHRFHHQNTDTPDDPHSPSNIGLKRLFFGAIEVYNQAYEIDEVKKLNIITDNDWYEKNIYVHRFGILLFLILTVCLYGVWGIPMWLVLMTSMVVVQNFLINGMGHCKGYRNFKTRDDSTNVSRFGIIACGEELHNNHHQSPRNPRFSRRINEIDIGWCYIKLLLFFRVAKLRQIRNKDILRGNKHELSAS